MMRRSRHPRAMALIVVLAALVVTSTALLSLARASSTLAVTQSEGRAAATADDLLRHLDAVLSDWLQSEADSVVLPLDSRAPSVAVLADRWKRDGGAVAVTITAFDQCGMVPISASSGSPLRAALPPELQPILGQRRTGNAPLRGLDQIETALPRFPPATAAEGIAIDDAPAIAAGAMIATHNDDQLVNLNTAPRPLIEAVARVGGWSPSDVVAARAQGQRSGLPEQPGRSTRRVRPVLASSVWSFRIDLTVDGITRSWWATYTRPSTRRPWRLVQRIIIDA